MKTLNTKAISILPYIYKNNTLLNIISKSISAKDLKINNISEEIHIKHDPTFNPNEQANFDKEYNATHPTDIKLEKIRIWGKAPFNLGLFDTNRDTELGRYAWNSNGGYINSISKILYRSKILQNKILLNFFSRNFDHRYAMDINIAEEPPKITPNSVYIYRDVSNTTLTRRGVERLAVFMLISQAWNLPSALMYLFLAFYFQLLQKNVSLSRCMVKRMDLIPETEQLHIMKIGIFGFPRSELVNVKDLIKIEKEDDLTCNNISFKFKFEKLL
jgi:hypothetical protein